MVHDVDVIQYPPDYFEATDQTVIMRNLWSCAGFVLGPHGLPQFVGTAAAGGDEEDAGEEVGPEAQAAVVETKEGDTLEVVGFAVHCAADRFPDIIGDEPSKRQALLSQPTVTGGEETLLDGVVC